MRDFFILALETLIVVIIVLLMIGVLVFAVMATGSPPGGASQGLLILIGGALQVEMRGDAVSVPRHLSQHPTHGRPAGSTGGMGRRNAKGPAEAGPFHRRV
jgi:hypothetical protein